MKYSVCIDSVFRGMDALAALDQVKASGFEAFEFWRWYDRDMEALREKAAALGLMCVTFIGKKANLTDPEERELWLECLNESIRAAKKMGNTLIMASAGDDTGAVSSFQHRAVMAALRAAVPALEENDITLLLEPLNGRVDHAGTYLESSDEAFAILDEVGSRKVKLLFDIYHQQISEGDIIHRMTSRIGQIGHIHSAGIPGRHELDTGELDYKKIFSALAGAGYDGYIGLEYFPQGDGVSSLKRMYDYLHA